MRHSKEKTEILFLRVPPEIRKWIYGLRKENSASIAVISTRIFRAAKQNPKFTKAALKGVA